MIIIAISVMFLLAFIAGLFLSLISRNIGRTARGGDVLQAQYLAEAGIRYADQQLTHSILGADWRPDPDVAYLVVPPSPALGGDPDFAYLQAGYTRFNQGNGRFLLRVSYQPVKLNAGGDPVDSNNNVTNDPAKMVYPNLDKYIKIECIGRRGVVDENDPTTWRNADPLHRTLVAYKPIGITDYARYVTNKDRSDNTMVLGAFPFPLPKGNDDANFRTRIVGPVRVNGDLMWTGLDALVLNAAETMDTGSAPPRYSPTLGTFGVNRNDTVAVAGSIFHDELPSGLNGDQVTLDNRGAGGVTGRKLLPSDDPAFTTAGGVYRDGSPGISGNEGRMRGVGRLEPPMMDDVEPSTGILRYRLLTRNTGIVLPGKSLNTGQSGLGMGVYVDNGGEIQKDNQFRRLMDEWSRTGTGRESESRAGSAWRQYLYTPPGAEVYLDPTPSRDLNTDFPKNQSQGTIIITRHDGKAWKGENGGAEGFTRRYRYPLRQVYDRLGVRQASETYGTGGDDFRDASGAYKTFQNGVLFFEGNVRLQGKLPADWVGGGSAGKRVIGQHLTFVTLGTAYIEGNLLKGDASNESNVNGFGKGLQVGSITVIAKDYVCVNSTAYFMKQPDSGAWNYGMGNPYTELAAAGEKFVTSGYSAVNPGGYPPDALGAKQQLMLLQTAEGYPGGAAEFNVFAYANADNDVYQSGSLFGLGIPMVVTPGQSSQAPAENIWEHKMVPLLQAPNNLGTSWELRQRPLADWFSLTYRPYYATASSGGAEFTQNYGQPLWLSRVAISPMDVRIEAVMYAQEGSFFVIPGEWMNGNQWDTRADNLNDSLRRQDPVRAGWRTTDNPDRSPFPFYGEPADIRVVICGAIAENTPADKDYQTAWTRHWGWTPKVRPDGTDGAHGGEGLVYMYDHDLRLPLRFDRFNRPLPPTPALPVSPDMVFSGEAA
jgi:hypothetical protein